MAKQKKENEMNMVDKYYWLIEHPILKINGEHGQGHIELTPHMVNPKNNTIDEDLSLNTKLEWWVELCGLELVKDADGKEQVVSCHLVEFDTGGDTAEEAIENLYNLFLKEHGEY